VLVLPEVSRHALIKLTDSQGKECGQGVICLRHAFPTSARSSFSSLSSSEGGREGGVGVVGAPVQAFRRLVGGDKEKEKEKGSEKR